MPAMRFCTLAAVFAGLLLFVADLAASQTKYNLFTFPATGSGGFGAIGPLVSDAAGNLYGATFYGGTSSPNFCLGEGCGVVFELERPIPPAKGWKETILYQFTGRTDGGEPVGGVVFDRNGNLYGVTQHGGSPICAAGCGVVYQLTQPTGGGAWTENVLYTFLGSTDGWQPNGGLTFDTEGNLYGVTAIGGTTNPGCSLGCGVVFQLVPPGVAGQNWTENVIESFKYATGGGPGGSVIFDARGNLYGTGRYGGRYTWGMVYRLAPPTGGGTVWTYRTLHPFGPCVMTYECPDGASPIAGLTLHDGVLYGTTSNGPYGEGAVFALSAAAGVWTNTVLHGFRGTDGAVPNSSLLFDKSGNILGVTNSGGSASCGSVFELTPPSGGTGTWTETVVHSFSCQKDGSSPSSLVFTRGIPVGGAYGVIFGIAP